MAPEGTPKVSAISPPYLLMGTFAIEEPFRVYPIVSRRAPLGAISMPETQSPVAEPDNEVSPTSSAATNLMEISLNHH
jgi:hypothetical protein